MSAWSMSKGATRVVDWLLSASLLLTLFGWTYIGSYSRYMADDYSALRSIRTHGFFRAQINLYYAWTGRFSFTFLNSLVALLGPITPRFVPGVLLMLWFSATIWALHRIEASSRRVCWRRIVLFVAFVVFATLETAPNIFQSLYWQTGALTYIAPFIPLSLFIGVISWGMGERQKRLSYKFSLLCAGILPFVAGGFSDAYVVLQSCGLLVSVLIVEYVAKLEFKTRIRPFLLIGLAGSLVAFTIVALAPGNSIRRSYFPKQFYGWASIGVTVTYSVRFIAKLILTDPLIVLVSLVLPSAVVIRDFSHGCQPTLNRQESIRLLLVIPAAVLLLIMSCTATSVFAISVMLPERARILLSVTFVCGTVLWSWAAGNYVAWRLVRIKRKSRDNISVAATVALLLLIPCPLQALFLILDGREGARSFAADWDRQNSELKAARQNGTSDVTVQQIGDFQSRIGNGESDLHLRTDPAFWINQTTATYYGLRSVRANEDVATSR